MKLSGQKVTVLLSEDGKAVLALAAIGLSGASSISVSVEEAEELGIWIRVPREDQMHLFLLLWGYIVAVEIPTGGGKLLGMRS